MKQTPRLARLTRVLPVLISLIGVAFLLRLINIDTFGFWTDEGLTPLRASYPLAQIFRNEIIIQNIVTKDTHPPLYYLIIHFTRPLLGESDFAYRFPSVLLGILLVPLIYQFGRRLHNHRLGLLATALIAINPLHIWYANEARMYTLFAFLAAAASYVLWRALSGVPLIRSLILYVLLAGLALYTHYTAVFLIAAQAPFWIVLLWRNGQKKLIIAAGVVGLLAFIPLIPVTIPRLFTGAEANYSYVQPIVMLQDVVRFFSLGVTVDFNDLGIQLLAVMAFALLLLGVYAAHTWQNRAFLLAYLLAIVFGLMVGSLLKPMYQGVRHIMAGSPAFILLIAWGIIVAGERARQNGQGQRLWGAVGAAGLLIVLLGPFIAIHNLYNQPDIYAKDDFRALIAQMETLAGNNDVIVYNNAIHLPLHEHYRTRADVAATAVPVYPTLALETAVADLIQLTERYDRIWFVTDPPADPRDDDHLTQQWLEENLALVANTYAHARTTVVESLTFATAVTQVERLPANTLPLSNQWPNLPTLRGFRLEETQPLTQPAVWFYLYWDAATTPPATRLRFTLQDQDNHEWLAAIDPIQTAPNQSWAMAGFNQQIHQLILPTGFPPGDYTLFIQPLEPEPDSITPLGDPQPITHLEIGANAGLPATDWPQTQRIQFDNGLQLLSWQLYDKEVRPGHNLPLTLYWQTNQPLATNGLRYELALIKSDGTLLRHQIDPPGAQWLTDWPINTPIREQTGLYIRPETEPGEYRLRWQLVAGDEVVAGRPLLRPWSTDTITMGSITVIPWPLETNPPADVSRSTATFGDIHLYGYNLDTTESGQVQIELIWQATAEPEASHFLFVHLVDNAGNIIAQSDRIPGNTLRPTTGWRESEIITDTLTLTLPPGSPPGDYDVRIGFYDPETGARLPAMVDGQPQANDQVKITTVTIP